VEGRLAGGVGGVNRLKIPPPHRTCLGIYNIDPHQPTGEQE